MLTNPLRHLYCSIGTRSSCVFTVLTNSQSETPRTIYKTEIELMVGMTEKGMSHQNEPACDCSFYVSKDML